MLLLLSIAIVTSNLARAVNMSRFITYSVLFVALFIIGASACSAGDKACHCKKIGGEWRPAEGNLAPACRVFYNHQGKVVCKDPAAAADLPVSLFLCQQSTHKQHSKQARASGSCWMLNVRCSQG